MRRSQTLQYHNKTLGSQNRVSRQQFNWAVVRIPWFWCRRWSSFRWEKRYTIVLVPDSARIPSADPSARPSALGRRRLRKTRARRYTIIWRATQRKVHSGNYICIESRGSGRSDNGSLMITLRLIALRLMTPAGRWRELSRSHRGDTEAIIIQGRSQGGQRGRVPPLWTAPKKLRRVHTCTHLPPPPPPPNLFYSQLIFLVILYFDIRI